MKSDVKAKTEFVEFLQERGFEVDVVSRPAKLTTDYSEVMDRCNEE